MKNKECYDLGKAAHEAGKTRDPMRDHGFVSHIQIGGNEDHAPMSPGAIMTEAQRGMLQDKINCWKQGWDEAHKEDSE